MPDDTIESLREEIAELRATVAAHEATEREGDTARYAAEAALAEAVALLRRAKTFAPGKWKDGLHQEIDAYLASHATKQEEPSCPVRGQHDCNTVGGHAGKGEQQECQNKTSPCVPSADSQPAPATSAASARDASDGMDAAPVTTATKDVCETLRAAVDDIDGSYLDTKRLKAAALSAVDEIGDLSDCLRLQREEIARAHADAEAAEAKLADAERHSQAGYDAIAKAHQAGYMCHPAIVDWQQSFHKSARHATKQDGA